ncbi:MAG: methionyl-tRNA formyltransferase [Candidatus Protochlamydia sp.]|nr:methionyl-tRNA formyltransferase [Candidatus Protochlamydia sp.]
MKVIFFGTPTFAAHVLTFLLQNQVNIVAVISKPDRPKGRSSTPVPTPVKLAASFYDHAIPVHQPEFVSSVDFAGILQSYGADLFVIVAYGEIIKQNLLDMPGLGCINLHASLLPKYRGAAPIQHSIIQGEKESGVTIMHMVKKMDAGDMIKKASVPIGPDMTYAELEAELCEIGKKLLFEVIMDFEKETLPRTPQDHALATLAPKIELENCEIDWSRPAVQIHDLVRGVNPHPGAWCYVKIRGEQKRLKINRTRIVPVQHASPGTVLNLLQTKENIIVATGHQALELIEVQLEGKKIMSSSDLTRGIPRVLFIFT